MVIAYMPQPQPRSIEEINRLIMDTCNFVEQHGQGRTARMPPPEVVSNIVLSKVNEVIPFLPQCTEASLWSLSHFFVAIFNEVSDETFRQAWFSMSSEIRLRVEMEMMDAPSYTFIAVYECMHRALAQNDDE